ncbi:MAG: hypothetical protein ABJB85_05980 [Nitrososphaerota archaeon]
MSAFDIQDLLKEYKKANIVNKFLDEWLTTASPYGGMVEYWLTLPTTDFSWTDRETFIELGISFSLPANGYL